MDIRPVDVQMFINKSSQTNKNENMEQRGAEQYQLYSEYFQKSTKEQQQKTIETNKTDDSQINKDGKNSRREKGKQSKKNNDKKQDKNKHQKLGLFDVSI